MEKFNFHLDQKVTTWMRTEFEIEAETMELAVKIAKEKYESGDLYDIRWEEIAGVKEIMEVGENGGEPTEELYDENSNLVLNNTK